MAGVHEGWLRLMKDGWDSGSMAGVDEGWLALVKDGWSSSTPAMLPESQPSFINRSHPS
jgi:hypothetical protein